MATNLSACRTCERCSGYQGTLSTRPQHSVQAVPKVDSRYSTAPWEVSWLRKTRRCHVRSRCSNLWRNCVIDSLGNGMNVEQGNRSWQNYCVLRITGSKILPTLRRGAESGNAIKNGRKLGRKMRSAGMKDGKPGTRCPGGDTRDLGEER